MAEKLYFKVRGMFEGRYQVELESGEFRYFDAIQDKDGTWIEPREFTRFKEANTELATNDRWPNRPDDAPAPIAGGLPIIDGGTQTQVLLEFAKLTAAQGRLEEQHKTLLDNQAALETRIIEAEEANEKLRADLSAAQSALDELAQKKAAAKSG